MPLARSRRNTRKTARKARNRPGKGRKGGRRIPRSISGGTGQYARIVETSDIGTLDENLSYTGSFNIRDFPRALEMSKLFQWYRPVVVTYRYIPLFNVFQESSVPNQNYTMPQFYSIMNRTGMNDNFSLADFQKMGAKPRPFNKYIKVSYKPNLVKTLQVVQNPVGSDFLYNQGVVPHYGWVQTYDGQRPVDRDPAQGTLITYNNPTFLGHDVFFSVALDTGTVLAVARTSKTVVWEFKQPRYPHSSSSNVPITIVGSA